jgi:glycerol-3-phosphate dehydrogenase
MGGGPLTVGEVRFFAREEMAISADDVAYRRTRLFLEGKATTEVRTEIERVLSQLRAEPDAQRPAGVDARPRQEEKVGHAAV